MDKNLRFINPDYIGAGKMTQNAWAMAYIPRYIYGYKVTSNQVVINRGFWKNLCKWLEKQNKNIKLKDNTIVRKANLDLTGVDMRDYQVDAAKVALKRSGGVIKMPCGAGKTRAMLDIMVSLDQHTLVIVHTKFLLNQWKEYIKDLYNYDVGIIQGKVVEIKPFTIAMIQTLHGRKLTHKFRYRWGCIVVDETHHVPAQSFSDIVNRFPAKYRFGLSATLKRPDGLSRLIFAGIGKLIYTISAAELAELGYLQIPMVETIPTEFYYRGKYANIMKRLINDRKRNELIITTLMENQDRFNLVLSNRIEHLTKLSEMYALHSDDYEVIIGKVKAKDRNSIIERMKSGDLHTIFATTLADEGLDIPNLDTVYLVFPTKSDIGIEQRIGRIQRIYPGKPTPIVYDFSDYLIPRLLKFAIHRANKYEDLELHVQSNRKVYRPSLS